VTNGSEQTLPLDVYPAAATVSDEEFRFGEGHSANELTSWTTLDRDHVILAAGEAANVTVTIAVPPEASVGERYAVIWASATSQPSDPSANVTQVHRVGVRVYLDVGPGGEPISRFTIDDVTPTRDADGTPRIRVGVHNTGARALDFGGSISLSEGPAGMRAGPFPVAMGTTLAAGHSGTVEATLPATLPDGPWLVRIELSSGTVRDSASARLTFPAPGTIGETAPAAMLSGPWRIIAPSLVVGVLILGGLWLAARRSAAAARRPRH
jgi:hypothetical protein